MANSDRLIEESIEPTLSAQGAIEVRLLFRTAHALHAQGVEILIGRAGNARFSCTVVVVWKIALDTTR